jgi:hypothetical protein
MKKIALPLKISVGDSFIDPSASFTRLSSHAALSHVVYGVVGVGQQIERAF